MLMPNNIKTDSPRSLKDMIKAEALRLGFSLCGITSVDPPDEYYRYEYWLRQDHQAGMSYLSSERHRELRKSPAALFSEARSIISLGWQVPLRNIEQMKPGNQAWVAGYVGQKDYHTFLPQKMDQLVEFIQSNTDEEVKAMNFTDSAPILERELAVRAGLGWIGKNSCLISPDHGSSILLAEIFINLPLSVDDPFSADRCGSCSRCIESCPTGCILPDRTISSSSCISYLTIENKGTIPEHLRDQFGNWFFGCDLCQIVCPWNQKGSGSEEAQNMTPEELISLLSMSASQFNTKYKDSAFSRAKRHGLQRNALVWMGNHLNFVDVKVIDNFMTHCENPVLFELAGWVKNKIKNK